MMQKLTLSVKLLIRVLLPFHKQQPNRLALLTLPAAKGQQAINHLLQANNKAQADMMVTAQTMVLQRHLSQLFNADILIVHNRDAAFNVGLSADGEHTFVLIGLQAQNEAPVLIPGQGEAAGSLPVDFRVIAPAWVSIDALTAEVSKYRLAGKRFDIAQYPPSSLPGYHRVLLHI